MPQSPSLSPVWRAGPGVPGRVFPGPTAAGGSRDRSRRGRPPGMRAMAGPHAESAGHASSSEGCPLNHRRSPESYTQVWRVAGELRGICQLWRSDPASWAELQACKLPTMWITPVDKFDGRRRAWHRVQGFRKSAAVSDQRIPDPGRVRPEPLRKSGTVAGSRQPGAQARQGARWRRRAGQWPQ